MAPSNDVAIRHVGSSTIDRAAVLERKGRQTVSVCIPCRDEAATIGSLVSLIRSELLAPGAVFVDELIVVDDRSTDDSARTAADAGAKVVSITDVHVEHGDGHGKGNVLWASLLASHGDIVVWLDADVTSFEADWVIRLAQPLLDDQTLAMVKARYHRPTNYGGGGRTTELVARPLISRLYPTLAGLAQPLSGEYAARRSVLESLPFVQGWGVEMGLLIDIERRLGAAAIGEVDLGSRLHRHRSLTSLSVQAAEVMSTMLDRAGIDADSDEQVLRRADGSIVPLNLDERPPVRDVRNERRGRLGEVAS